DADRAHAVMDSAGAEASLSNCETATFSPEQVGYRHSAILINDLAVAAAARMTHHRDRADNVQSGSIDRDDDLAGAFVRRRLRVGHDHRDGEGRADGAGGEPF